MRSDYFCSGGTLGDMALVRLAVEERLDGADSEDG
jgi:hypothetical protein